MAKSPVPLLAVSCFCYAAFSRKTRNLNCVQESILRGLLSKFELIQSGPPAEQVVLTIVAIASYCMAQCYLYFPYVRTHMIKYGKADKSPVVRAITEYCLMNTVDLSSVLSSAADSTSSRQAPL